MSFTHQFSIWQYKLFPGHTSPPLQKQGKIKIWSFGLRSPELWSVLLLTCSMSQVNHNLKVSDLQNRTALLCKCYWGKASPQAMLFYSALSMQRITRPPARALFAPWTSGSVEQVWPGRDWGAGRHSNSREAQQGKSEVLACAPSVKFKIN